MALTTLRPEFFFTDKETSQISAIRKTYTINPSLCLWHCKRDLKGKLSEISMTCAKQDMVQQHRLLSLFDKHYFTPVSIMQRSAEQLRKLALLDLEQLFSSVAGKEMLRCLHENWYCSKWWLLWGRRHNSLISLSRTTMIVESHWSILKRLYLIPYNRSSVDFLMYIIEKKMMSKFREEFTLLVEGLKKPSRYQHFAALWNPPHTPNRWDHTLRIWKILFAHALRGAKTSSSFVSIS